MGENPEPMSDLIAHLRPVLLEALGASSAYIQDLDEEGRAIAAENGEVYTGRQGVLVDGVIDPDDVLRAIIEAAALSPLT